jgi:hypothetical protein
MRMGMRRMKNNAMVVIIVKQEIRSNRNRNRDPISVYSHLVRQVQRQAAQFQKRNRNRNGRE